VFKFKRQSCICACFRLSLDQIKIVNLAMKCSKNEEKTRSRSRSAGRCGDKASGGRSGHKKNAKQDALPPDVPAECSHVPPPPYRPAGPFALYFAANFGTVEGKEVIHVVNS